MIVKSPLQLLHISMKISYENLVLHQDNNFYLISLSIFITCLLDSYNFPCHYQALVLLPSHHSLTQYKKKSWCKFGMLLYYIFLAAF